MQNIQIKKLLLIYSSPSRDILIKILIEPFACLVTHITLKSNITANQVTAFNFISSFFFISLDIFFGNHFFLIGIFFFFIFDFVDGKIARVKKQSSPSGKRLDFLVDRIVFILYGSYFYFIHKKYFIDFSLELFLIYILIYLSKDYLEMSHNILKYEINEFNKSTKEKKHNNLIEYYLDKRSLIPTRLSSPLLIIITSYIFNNFIISIICGILSIYAKNFVFIIKKYLLIKHK